MTWTEKTVHVEKKVAHGNPRVSHDMVCSIDDVSMGLTAHGLLRSLMTSVDTLGHSKCDNSFSSGPYSKTHAGGRLLSIIYI